MGLWANPKDGRKNATESRLVAGRTVRPSPYFAFIPAVRAAASFHQRAHLDARPRDDLPTTKFGATPHSAECAKQRCSPTKRGARTDRWSKRTARPPTK